MLKNSAPRAAALALILVVTGAAGCGKKTPPAFTSVTPVTHRFFPIATGVHAVDCAACHQAYASFKQFDCLTCHVQPPTAAVHTTTPGYVYSSTACLGCHADPLAHPYDHAGVTNCAGCHQSGAFYAALPVAGFTHAPIGTADCKGCHSPSTWLNVVAPPGVVSDPNASIQVNAMIPVYSATAIAALSNQTETLPMGMDHATTEVNVAAMACSTCHTDANAGAFFPGQLHSTLANRSQPAPTACVDCHLGSVPTGFVGPTASNPARTPPSGEMKHDAVVWSAGAPTATRLVTADCGVCHVSPTAAQVASWATSKAGTTPAQFHASLTAATIAQPGSCVDCHANGRPVGPVSTATTAQLPPGLTFDHDSPAALADCAACHASTTAWSGGVFHKSGSANPATCLPCHAGQRPTSDTGWTSTVYKSSPFDYGTNVAGITHGDGQDCAVCHTGPGTGGAWGGLQTFVGGKFPHGPATVAATTCIACHMSQRPDLVLGQAAAKTALNGFDHAVVANGDCIGCHQVTVAAGNYLNYYGAGGAFPGGDWQGGQGYPGDKLVSAPNRFVTVTEISLTRASPGALVTGMTSIQDTLYNAMLHTSAQIPAAMSPGPAASPDYGTCWHCHTHDALGNVTAYGGAVFHAALSTYQANVSAPVTPLPQPTTGCTDCHSQMRPPNVVERAASDLQPMDHAALFTGTVTIGGQTVTGVGGLDCSTCHASPGVTWTDGAFHTRIGAAVPADCVACHYPLMADGPRANLVSGVLYAMAHGSKQLTFQTCATCHTGALAASTTAPPYAATTWKPGAYHGSVPSQPTRCIDCHKVSQPAANQSTQSSWSYTMALGNTATNNGQWMNHGAASVAGADCATCHVADAKASGSAWSTSTQFHLAVSVPGTCQACHGLTNGGGTVVGTNNNMPAGLTSSNTLTTASVNALTGVPAGTFDQITHADVNVTGHDCSFCHTQAGRSTAPGVQGAEWAQARFHASFSAATPLLLNGSTGRCSNCHLGLKPGPSYTAMDHSALTGAAGTQDCSACHSWPGTGGPTTPNWKGATAMPQFITVGGFTIPAPPATTPTTQTGIANLPHPTVPTGGSCATCHTGGVGGKKAIGYDHASALINQACSACHEAGSNLVGTVWNGATSEAAGAGDTRPFTLTSVVARKGGLGGDTCTVTAANHFYPVQCGQCHAMPAGTGAVTTGTAYATVWYFPHITTNMTNPGTCNLCHNSPSCPK